MALVPGSNAGPYRIVEPLGRGGMASVYRAYEAALDRYVALKVLPREFLHDPDFAKRFDREAKAIARLEHPNIVPIYAYDIDRTDGIPWMAMRLIDGGSLSQLIRSGRPGLPRAVAILRGVADALDYAHGKGIVHRDVKPQNVLLDSAGRVYLADFGIAKMAEAAGGLTATGMITGTPQYMAPEQATGKSVGPAADVYALGIVAYEMFTGAVPFAADTPVAIMIKHMQEPLPIPPASALPEAVLRPLLKCTAKKPQDRWPSAGAFVSALEAALDVPTAALAGLPTLELAPPPGPPTLVAPPRPPARPPLPSPRPVAQPAKSPRRGNGILILLALLGLGLAGLAVIAVGAWWALGRAPQPAPPPVTVTEIPAVGAARKASPPPGELPAELPTPGDRTQPTLPSVRETGSAAEPPDTVAHSRPPEPTPVPTPRPTPTPVPPPTPAPTPVAPAVDPEVQQLVAALGQPDTAARWRAAQALGSFRAEAAPAVPALTAALGDRSSEVRWRSAEALGLIGAAARPAVPALVRVLSDTDPIVRAETIKALGLLGPVAAEAVSALAQALAAPDVSIRREAARALGRIGAASAPALRLLLEALKDKDKFVRMESARALGRVGPSAREAIPALTAAARDPELLVSREAQAALQAIGN